MKTRPMTALSLLMLLAIAASAPAGDILVPRMTYQGYLEDDGEPMNGDVALVFSLWTGAQSQPGDSPLWFQNAVGTPVVDGVFSVQLVMDANDLTADERWLEIAVNGQIMSPRQRLTASPYSLQTRGIHVDHSGDVGIGTNDPQERVHIVGGSDVTPQGGGSLLIGTGNSQLAMDGNEIMARNAVGATTLGLNAEGGNVNISGIGDGRVGIRTNNPKQTLHVNGDYYGLGHLYLHAFEGDGADGTAYVQARDDSGASTIAMMLRTQVGGQFVNAVDISPSGNVNLGGPANGVLLPPRLSVRGGGVSPFTQTPLFVERDNEDGTLITFLKSTSFVGSISVANGVVSYNAFTGSHYAWTDDLLPVNALVRMTGENRLLHEHTAASEVLYGIEVVTKANDPACLGVYTGPENPSTESIQPGPHLVASVGNGAMWVARGDESEIVPGDLLITSDVAGCAMKDDPRRFATGNIIARAASVVRWEEVVPDADGVQRALVSVLYDSFVRPAIDDRESLASRVAALESKLRDLTRERQEH